MDSDSDSGSSMDMDRIDATIDRMAMDGSLTRERDTLTFDFGEFDLPIKDKPDLSFSVSQMIFNGGPLVIFNCYNLENTEFSDLAREINSINVIEIENKSYNMFFEIKYDKMLENTLETGLLNSERNDDKVISIRNKFYRKDIDPKVNYSINSALGTNMYLNDLSVEANNIRSKMKFNLSTLDLGKLSSIKQQYFNNKKYFIKWLFSNRNYDLLFKLSFVDILLNSWFFNAYSVIIMLIYYIKYSDVGENNLLLDNRIKEKVTNRVYSDHIIAILRYLVNDISRKK